MKCAQADVWLLTSGSLRDLPSRVDQHVRSCTRCRRLKRRLKRLHQVASDAPLPPGCLSAQKRFCERLATLPVARPPRPARPAKPAAPDRPIPEWARIGPLHRVAPIAAAAVILLLAVAAVLIWPKGKLPDTSSHPMGPMAAEDASDSQFLAHLVDRDLRLAAADNAIQQLAALSDMANDLRDEAVRQAHRSGGEDLVLVTTLYEHVVRLGCVGRAKALTPQQADRRAALLTRLGETERLIGEKLADVPSTNAVALRSVLEASRHARITLDPPSQPHNNNDPELAPLPRSADAAQALLMTVVLNGLQLAEVEDHAVRAELCQDLAGRLMQTMVMASGRGDREEAARLSDQLEQVLERGLTNNLAQIRKANPNDPRLAELDQSLARTTRTLQGFHSPGRPNMFAQGFNEDARKQAFKDLEKGLHDLDKVVGRVAWDHRLKMDPGLARDHKGPFGPGGSGFGPTMSPSIRPSDKKPPKRDDD